MQLVSYSLSIGYLPTVTYEIFLLRDFFFFFLYKIFVDIKNKNKKYSSNENITNYYNLQMHYVCRFFFFF